MIKINLLPVEFRAKVRMPLASFAALLLGIVLLGSSASYFLFVQFVQLGSVVAQRQQLEDELASYQPQVKYHDDLTKEASGYEKREEKIREITHSRILWTKKLDQFADVINTGEDKDRYTVWFDNIDIDQLTGTQPGRSQAKDGGSVKGKGRSGSANYANMANFFEDMASTEFILDFQSISAPEGNKTEPKKDLVPSQIFEFPLELKLKPREAKKPAPATPAPAAKPQGKQG